MQLDKKERQDAMEDNWRRRMHELREKQNQDGSITASITRCELLVDEDVIEVAYEIPVLNEKDSYLFEKPKPSNSETKFETILEKHGYDIRTMDMMESEEIKVMPVGENEWKIKDTLEDEDSQPPSWIESDKDTALRASIIAGSVAGFMVLPFFCLSLYADNVSNGFTLGSILAFFISSVINTSLLAFSLGYYIM